MMSRNNLFQKKFNLKKYDKVWIDKLFNMRDKVKYPTEGEYVTYILITFRESDNISNGDLYQELIKICAAKELIKSGDYLVCSRGGTFSTQKQYYKRKKPHVFKIGKNSMSLDTVKRMCERCFINGTEYRRNKRYYS